MYDIGIIIKILLELDDIQSSIPPYRFEEIEAAEEYINNLKSDIRKLFDQQKNEIKECLLKIKSVNQSSNTGINLSHEQEILNVLVTPPDVALYILISNHQQLRRGICIYKYERTKRILNVIFRELLEFSDSSTFKPSQELLKNCSHAELRMVQYIVEIMADHGLQDGLHTLPFSVCADQQRNTVTPPTWILKLLKEDDTILDQTREYISFNYYYTPLYGIDTSQNDEELFSGHLKHH